jgi:uncharacterized membrane protein
MTKNEFLKQLEDALKYLPQSEIEQRVSFYSEMIEDKIEEGILEEEAVSSIGTVEEIVSQIVEEFPLARIVKQKITNKKKLKAWEIVLLALGSPIWLSLLVAFFAVVFSLYVSVWAVIISLWAVFVSFVASGISGVIGGLIFVFTQNTLTGVWMLGASLVLAGLSIFSFYGCEIATKYLIIFTKKTVLWIKKFLLGKDEV